MKYKLSIISLLLLSATLFGCVRSGSFSQDSDTVLTEQDVEVDGTAIAGCTPDMGEEYVDSFIFFGESTTYHLKSRGVLKGGKNTCQVWAPSGGTVNLDTTISSVRIVYPQTGEVISLGEALKRSRPQRILLTFGLNGAVEKIKRGEDYFRTCYRSLINTIRENSPDTKIILQSCFPISSSMDMSNYSVDVATLNGYIDRINGWTLSLAEDEGIYYLDSASVFKGEDGFLLPKFDSGDGHHLSREAYIAMLQYLRTHGVS